MLKNRLGNVFLRMLFSLAATFCLLSSNLIFSQELIAFPVHGALIHLKKTEVSPNHFHLELEIAENQFVSLGLYVDEAFAGPLQAFQSQRQKLFTKVSEESIDLKQYFSKMDRPSQSKDPVSKALFLSGLGLSFIRDLQIVIYPHALYFNFLDLNTSRAFELRTCRQALTTL